jgi:hypothetical protein
VGARRGEIRHQRHVTPLTLRIKRWHNQASAYLRNAPALALIFRMPVERRPETTPLRYLDTFECRLLGVQQVFEGCPSIRFVEQLLGQVVVTRKTRRRQL